MPGRGGRDPLARAAGQRPADRRVQPVPAAARRLPAARPDVRLRGGRPAVGPDPGRARHRSATSGRSSSSTGSAAGQAGDIRFRLVNQVLRDAAEARPVAAPRRVHRPGRQRRAVHAGRVRPLRRRADPPPRRRPGAARRPGPRARCRPAGSGPSTSLDALPLARLYAAATPQPVQRLEGIRLPDWERQGTNWRVPRSSLAPILRFADVEAFVQESADGGKDGTAIDGFAQVGVAKEDQPHYLKLLGRPDADLVVARRRSRSGSSGPGPRRTRRRAASTA